jgi:hypothetical protein
MTNDKWQMTNLMGRSGAADQRTPRSASQPSPSIPHLEGAVTVSAPG